MPDLGNHVEFLRHAYPNSSLLFLLDRSLFPLDRQAFTPDYGKFCPILVRMARFLHKYRKKAEVNMTILPSRYLLDKWRLFLYLGIKFRHGA